MSIRPIGHRALLRPIAPPESDSPIVLLDEPPTWTGEVVSVGKARCAECASPLIQALKPGMRVALRPHALYDEITDTLTGDTLWMVSLDDVIGEVLPVAAREDVVTHV